jgi:glutamate synthase (NADPH) large chain
MEMVELEKPEDQEDRDTIRTLLENHYQFTNSPLAKAVLDDFDNELRWFVKVMPTDYRRVLEERKQRATAGT